MAVKKPSKAPRPAQSVERVAEKIIITNPETMDVTSSDIAKLLTGFEALTTQGGGLGGGASDSVLTLTFESAKTAKAAFGALFNADCVSKTDPKEAAIGKLTDVFVSTRASWVDTEEMANVDFTDALLNK